MNTHNPPLSNLQLELLKLFSDNIHENDLLEIKKLIANYFAEKLMKEAGEIWEQKGYSDEQILEMHLRTPYKGDKK